MITESPLAARPASIGRRLVGTLRNIAAAWTTLHRQVPRGHSRRVGAEQAPRLPRPDLPIPVAAATPDSPEVAAPDSSLVAETPLDQNAVEPAADHLFEKTALAKGVGPDEPTPEPQASESLRIAETAAEAPLAPAAEAAEPPATAARPLALSQDPALENLRARIRHLEVRVFDLETRKADMNALLEEHAFRQYQALGELLREQLALRQQALHLRAERSQSEADRAAAAAAAEELAAFEKAARGTPPVEIEVTPEIEDELRSLYRSAAMRCHPDRVADADKAHAHEAFLRTQDAYRRRDLEALRLIDRQLGSDPKLARTDADRNALDHLQAILTALEDKGVELAMAIHEMQGEARYRVARQRERWDENFASLREQIENECAALRREIARY